MKVSELIRELEAFQKLHGDLGVHVFVGGEVAAVEVAFEMMPSARAPICQLVDSEYYEDDPEADHSNDCSYCMSGDEPMLLDKDGVKCSISGEPGLWSHASGEYYWPCPRKHPDLYPELKEDSDA